MDLNVQNPRTQVWPPSETRMFEF